MTGRYYVEAADWLRAVELDVVEVDDWETRARSSGGFAAPPLGVQWHHTAGSGSNPDADIAFMTEGSDDAPIGNIYLAVDGTVYMVSAGAANTAGKGGPWQMSRGTVPVDKGNTTTWAIEAANNGVGQTWPQVQLDAMFTISNTLNAHWGNQPSDLFSHAAYAPTRKIDPATAAAVEGPWKPRSSTSSGTWDVDDIKAEACHRANQEDDDMPLTDDEMERLSDLTAKKVWKFMTTDQTVNKPVTAEALLQYTRNAAAAADRQTKAS